MTGNELRGPAPIVNRVVAQRLLGCLLLLAALAQSGCLGDFASEAELDRQIAAAANKADVADFDVPNDTPLVQDSESLPDSGDAGDSMILDADGGPEVQPTDADTSGQDGEPATTLTLCNPCSTSGACAGVGSKCVAYGTYGSYCGQACGPAAPCPTGFACKAVQAVEGDTTSQCAPIGDPASCACGVVAKAQKLSTPCFAVNSAGKCAGIRACGGLGLSACSAAVPATETCDGADNDCDGELDEGTCDDGNVCTFDFCVSKTCKSLVDSGAKCDDGNACTTGDSCQSEACTGTVTACTAGPCADSACDAKTGTCATIAKPNGATCSDGSACTGADKCNNGTCMGTPMLCDDANPCTNETCDKFGGCQSTQNNLQCDDGDACTPVSQCTGGKCAAAPGDPKTPCVDGQECTVDSCDAKQGCVFKPLSAVACDDGNGCTLGDQCEAGKCVPGKDSCNCQSDADCAAKQTDKCQGKLVCDKSGGAAVCKVVANTQVVCAKPASTCQANACEKATGACKTANLADGTVCDADGSVCTKGDSCAAGLCKAAPLATCADDANACTKEACDPIKGCVSQPFAAPCSDGNACTSGDKCNGGACEAGITVVQCPANSACAKSACDAASGECKVTSVAGPCDDANLCTLADACANGVCAAGSAKPCDDGSACTTDSCKAETGTCQFLAKACSDGDLCTVDTCEASKGCASQPIKCDDGKQCTINACAATTGACTSAPLPCADSDPCTLDSCAEGAGCVHAVAPDGTACEAGVTACAAGKCKKVFASAIGLGETHSCAATANGLVRCWGNNGDGQLGTGDATDALGPVAVNGLLGAAVVDGGLGHSCAVVFDGSVTGPLRCWGKNADGQLGNGGTADQKLPVSIAIAPEIPQLWTAVATGAATTCALSQLQTVWCWGANKDLQLGQKDAAGVVTFAGDSSSKPLLVPALTGALGVATGMSHSCAATASKVLCWGRNDRGQLGFAPSVAGKSAQPTPVASLAAGVVAVTAGDYHTCALVGSGSAAVVVCWGGNDKGPCGAGAKTGGGGGNVTGPVAVADLTAPSALASGSQHTCAVVAGGEVRCWGDNGSGQLGNGTTAASANAVKVTGLVGAIGIAAGAKHTCAVRGDGSVYCWGDGANGRLGTGASSPKQLVPVLVAGSLPK